MPEGVGYSLDPIITGKEYLMIIDTTNRFLQNAEGSICYSRKMSCAALLTYLVDRIKQLPETMPGCVFPRFRIFRILIKAIYKWGWA